VVKIASNSPVIALCLGLGLGVLGACGGGLGDAKNDFRKGRYAEAKTELLALEVDERTWDEQRRCEYALYRGLVHNALGDRGPASIWLKEARALADAHPGILGADDLTRLQLALEGLGPDAAPAP
jgi:hypothetical protein